ncbi:hypothetical protein BDW69DRAFT_199948 [Aspergillus filifer]
MEYRLFQKHGVYPKETANIQPIIWTIQQWTDIIQDPNAVHIPHPNHCHYTSTHVHGWSQQTCGGQVCMDQQQQGQLEFQQSFLRVAWQQIFPTQKNSHLPPTLVVDHQQIAAKIKAQAANDKQQAARYLAGVHFQDMLAVVAAPDPEQVDPISQATQRVWDAMAQLAWRSQQTTPLQPLRVYMDEKSIQEHVRPWQQILLFIIRTQTDWPWRQKKPQYVMTARQHKTWWRVWQLASRPANGPAGKPPVPRSSPDPLAPDLDPSRIKPFIMTPLETACLEFCIKLLNQKTKVHKYKSPLALWLDPQYLDIIHMWAAAVEQGSWTGDAADDDLGMIMEDEGYAEGPELIPSSPPSSPLPSGAHAAPIHRIPRSRRMPFQAGVDWMVQQFMVCGQHGPVEVLLDWRTFGLKIHYNTTAPGHVTWMGQERLLYKQMEFTMGQLVMPAGSGAMAGHPLGPVV